MASTQEVVRGWQVKDIVISLGLNLGPSWSHLSNRSFIMKENMWTFLIITLLIYTVLVCFIVSHSQSASLYSVSLHHTHKQQTDSPMFTTDSNSPHLSVYKFDERIKRMYLFDHKNRTKHAAREWTVEKQISTMLVIIILIWCAWSTSLGLSVLLPRPWPDRSQSKIQQFVTVIFINRQRVSKTATEKCCQ